MSCCQPFSIPNPYYARLYGNKLQGYPNATLSIPCGWCLNCRKDRQNYFADRAKYEYKKRLTAAFVTFTYDDYHLFTDCLPNTDWVEYIEGTDVPYTTLNYDDLTRFIENIRKYIQKHTDLHNVLCQPDFSYMYVGEYGDVFNSHRPHFHVLFFGLDFAYCKKIFMDKWKKGLIDVLPVLNGGIEYVTKYMDKQLHGSLAVQEYDNHFIARPKLRCSNGFGKGLLTDNIKDITDNNYTYSCGRGLRRPISQYWRSLLQGNDLFHSTFDFNRSRDSQIRKMITYNLKDFKKSSRTQFQLRQARLREDKLRTMLINNGVAALDVRYYVSNKFGVPKIDRDKLVNLSDDIKHQLVYNYVNQLLEV